MSTDPLRRKATGLRTGSALAVVVALAVAAAGACRDEGSQAQRPADVRDRPATQVDTEDVPPERARQPVAGQDPEPVTEAEQDDAGASLGVVPLPEQAEPSQHTGRIRARLEDDGGVTVLETVGPPAPAPPAPPAPEAAPAPEAPAPAPDVAPEAPEAAPAPEAPEGSEAPPEGSEAPAPEAPEAAPAPGDVTPDAAIDADAGAIDADAGAIDQTVPGAPTLGDRLQPDAGLSAIEGGGAVEVPPISDAVDPQVGIQPPVDPAADTEISPVDIAEEADELETPDVASEPGVTCGATTCAPGKVCCNASCGICTDPGQSCSQRTCGMPFPPASTACGPVTCNVGQVCCNASCGICVSPGQTCDQRRCDDAITMPMSEYCGMMTCNVGFVCCNPSCGICTRPGEPCSREVCQ